MVGRRSGLRRMRQLLQERVREDGKVELGCKGVGRRRGQIHQLRAHGHPLRLQLRMRKVQLSGALRLLPYRGDQGQLQVRMRRRVGGNEDGVGHEGQEEQPPTLYGHGLEALVKKKWIASVCEKKVQARFLFFFEVKGYKRRRRRRRRRRNTTGAPFSSVNLWIFASKFMQDGVRSHRGALSARPGHER